MSTDDQEKLRSKCVVSVVIPAYNASQFIRKTIDGALAQTLSDIEIIVVDDESTDDTREVVAQYGSKVRLLTQKNQGCSAARNYGIREARGQYIALLDSDDIWLPEKLQLQVQACQEDPEVGMVTCGAYFINAQDVIFEEQKAVPFADRQKALEAFWIRNLIVGGPSSVLIPKHCFDEVGFFNVKMRVIEDWEMWIRLLSKFNLKSLPQTLVKYRFHDNNIHKQVERLLKVQIEVIKANGPKMGWVNQRKAYSFIYQDAACEYEQASNRKAVFLNAIKSILYYPLKAYDQDDKYALLVKSMIPSSALSVIRSFKKGLSRQQGEQRI